MRHHSFDRYFYPASVWNDMSISLSSKIRLMRSLVTSVFPYACESWVLKQTSKEEYKPWK